MRPCFLIVNPTSGGYSAAAIDRILHALTRNGLAPVLLTTATPQDAALFAARICAENEDPLILAAGGDGTVNGVLNGLVPGSATLGVIPLGTSNVLARELQIETVDEALQRVIRGDSRSIAAGEAECGGERRRFLLMAGAGVDGAIVQGVRLREKRALGKLAYFLSALRLLPAWDSSFLRVVSGGRSMSCHSVIVCNASRYGGNFLLAPETDLFTPTFQVLCLKGGAVTYLKLFLLLVLGRLTTSSSVQSFMASELEVSGEKAVQLDGDYFGQGTSRFRVIPALARLIV